LVIKIAQPPSPAQSEAIKDMIINEIDNYGPPAVYANCTNIIMHYNRIHTWSSDILTLHYHIRYDEAEEE